MRKNGVVVLTLGTGFMLLLGGSLQGANVEPGIGYTNGFGTQPGAVDWATYSAVGAGADAYDMDTDVNATIAADGVISPTISDPGNPPAANASATWSSPGLYLQTRPTGNRYTVLMGKFVNNTGSNANQVTISYQLTIAAGGNAEDAGMGTRVYYSLSGLTGSWTNIVGLNNMSSANGTLSMTAAVGVNLTNGGNLYLMWVDDNAQGITTDAANEIDNFSLLVTAATPLFLACTLNTPANDAVIVSGTSITALAAAGGGTAPYEVAFYMNSGAGNTDFGPALGTNNVAPYTWNLGVLVAGTYNIFATVTDGEGMTAYSRTNTFLVADPITFELVAPTNGAAFEHTNSVEGLATVAGGIAPYAVQFYLDNVPHGALVMSGPYAHDFGPLVVGDHTIKATVVDARGWTSNSAVSTVHINGPLAAWLMPTNGTSYNYGQYVNLTATMAGGTAPYTARFFTNDVQAGSVSANPATLKLGTLPVGSYACFVRATDTSIPMQQFDSATNLITILPNPLVATLTSPTNGATGTVGLPFTIAAAVTIGSPVTVSNVEFFVDGVSVGVDSAAPYSMSRTATNTGTWSIYALARDSLGRESYTATNQITFVVNPLANDNFANRIPLTGGSVHVTGSNVGATMQEGEPNRIGFTRWGATLWWSWTAPGTGNVTIDTFGSSFNTVLNVYTGSLLNALFRVTWNDDAPGGGGASQVTFGVVQGTEYQIQVGGFRDFFSGAIATGSLGLNILMPGSVVITAPANGSVFMAGTPFTVSATASSSSGAITNVSFYGGTTFYGSDETDPYSIVVTNAPVGTNALYAVGMDDGGVLTTSAVVNVLVANAITIVSPADGAVFLNRNPITVSAYTTLPSGAITNVEFFVDSLKIGEDASTPFSAVWSSVTGGSHRFTAIGRDDAGNIYYSTPVFIAVAQTLMPTGSVWNYLDTGTNLGTGWVAPDFDDSTWLFGPAELGYGDDVDGRPEATVVGYGPDPNNKYITTYFRRAFTVSNAASYASLLLNVKRDDGAVVYLRGQFAASYNMPGTYDFLTLGSNAADDGSNFWPASISSSFLVEGRNVCAVEIHQNQASSTDISFDLELLGIPRITRNIPPVVNIINPTNNTAFLAPASITLEATAWDEDDTVAKVEFYADNVKLGEATNSPYVLVWDAPPIGNHVLQAVGTDDQGVSGGSAPISITVYDAIGTPLAQITSPADGSSVLGPTNLPVTATVSAPVAVTNVQFLANGVAFANTTTAPYSALWTSSFGTNVLTAVASDANGLRGTSAPVVVIITAPPSNSVAPFVASQTPTGGSTVSNLTSIAVSFSETVIGVDASDMLINGVAATNVAGSGSNYTFTFRQPAYGTVNVSWASSHGITDLGWPSNLLFNAQAPGATWSYTLIDRVPPTISTKSPAAGATVASLTQVTVVFSETVTGVNASDFLVNGVPAFGISGAGQLYIFTFSMPERGLVSITWASAHGITDVAGNAFNATGTGATWTYNLDPRTVFVQTNTSWMLLKGLAEASAPIDVWRNRGFNDSMWSNTAAPFFYGDTGYTNASFPGTSLTDMRSNYTGIFLRKNFVVANPATVTNLFIYGQSDDGFIAWINGVEVARYNMASNEMAYNATALGPVTEPYGNGAGWTNLTLPDPAGYLLAGTNMLAVQAFNESLETSADFGFNAQLYTYVVDLSKVAPRIVSVAPPAGDVYWLTNITVRFSEPVTGIDGDDLLINGVSADAVSSTTNTTYTFSFAPPPFGPVAVTWVSGHGIQDLDSPPKPFDATAPGSTFTYSYVNPAAPIVALQSPAGGTTLTNLTQITVTFSKAVTGVDGPDLLLNGWAATNVTGSGAIYTFRFAQPAQGLVTVSWAADCGIRDLDSPPNAFDPQRANNIWYYNLLDQTPPYIADLSPPRGTVVLDLTSVTVTFSEAVTNVNASDLLVNGAPASVLIGSGATYTFGFPQPETTVVYFTWAGNHGITDLAATPNAFDATRPGATWSYITPDTMEPRVTSIIPPPGATLRSLRNITVTFSETVVGVEPSDLLMNGAPARSVSGSGAGPYLFVFDQPAVGPVQVRWNAWHGITDLAMPPNPLVTDQWSYVLNPSASFAGKVLINEIMYDPPGGQTSDEWVELYNASTETINLAGWQFTRGIRFTFPSMDLLPGSYLVVAADLAAFQAKYPGVSNVVGGWSGQLANSEETIELSTLLGEVVNRVHYANEGDWGRRERGLGAKAISIITRSGSTATVRCFRHNLANNDRVVISGADQPEYNGRFTASVTGPSTFNITVSGTPATPATGNPLFRQVSSANAAGWAWFSAAGGFGSSVELLHPGLPNEQGQSWASSTNVNGTPGAVNSVFSANVAPLILEGNHSPQVPRSTDSVAITARVQDELSNGVQSVTLYYRNHTANYGATPPAFSSTNMVDNGSRRDGVAGDGIFGAVLPAAANGNIMEFYVQAIDTSGLIRTWPAPAWETNGVGGLYGTPGQFANALYQVDNEVITDLMPSLRLVLTGTERAAWTAASSNSDIEPNATMIGTDGAGTEVRYNCGVRVRGAGSRGRTVKNNRLNVPNDRPWNGRVAMNLNCQFIHVSLLGNVLAQKSGVVAADSHVFQYRVNGVNPAPITPPSQGAGWGTFLMLKPTDGDLLADLFPDDPDGNVYRASTGNHNADFDYYDNNPDTYLTHGFYKTSNRSANDWSDLMDLCWAFSRVTPDADYIQAISTNANVTEFMAYFAFVSLINDGETKLGNGIGDDYALYRGEVDKRFVLIGHDFDTVFGQGDAGSGYYPVNTNSSIFLMLNPPNPNARTLNLRRFMTVFAPVFYSELKRMCDTTFHPSQFGPLVDQLLTGWGVGPDAATIAAVKSYAGCRRLVALSQIPLNLTVSSALGTSNGVLYTTSPSVTLTGFGNAIETRKVLVNGAQALWGPLEARWTNATVLQPGLNSVVVQTLNSSNTEFARATVDIWYDDGSMQNVSGTIASDTVWSAASGPYQVTASLTIPNNVTLTIQPGTTIYLANSVNLTVASGGRLLAEGNDAARIRFTRVPGGGNWGGITINGGAGTPETRMSYVHIEGNNTTAIHSTGGTVFLDHLTFGNLAAQYLSLDSSSFVVQECVFPTPTTALEPVHGGGGVKSGGRGIFLRNYFGVPTGYNDVIDFTGGSRPGQPIVQFIGNVFTGAPDDILDLDGTDAWVEGNIFMHVHKNGSPDSASAVSGGSDGSAVSEITIIGNLFYDCDQAALAKQGNFYTFFNNTIVRQTRVGGTDTNGSVVLLSDVGTAEGAGVYLEGNIIYDAEQLVSGQTAALVTYTNNIIANLQGAPWTGPGGNNVNADPMFKRVPLLSETTNFTSWAAAQVMWDWFSLRNGSPAAGAGPNGADLGGLVPPGVSISGEPVGTTSLDSATLRVGINRTGNGIPAGAFPNGSGFTHYRWRLDAGAWSAETPINTPISLSGLANGAHVVEVIGKNDAGFYQDDAVYGPHASVSVSRTWIVNTSASPLRLNEILASNAGAVDHQGTTPDLIELYNESSIDFDLTGVRLTDDQLNPDKFIFPSGASVPARGYLVVYANNPDGTPGYHLGFNLNQQGETVYLFNAADQGGALLDAISFGPQITDLSIGRIADGSWTLTTPTLDAPNRAAPTGNAGLLRINEWLALGQMPFDTDFIELYNSDSLPVSLGGLYLTDSILSWPDRHQIAALSYIPAYGYLRYIADGDTTLGPEHLNFSLDHEEGNLGLYSPELTPIDLVVYQAQRLNVSQGRTPNGGSTIVFFDTPTPGSANPLPAGSPISGGLVINELLALNSVWVEEDGRTPDWLEIYNGTSNTVDLSNMSLSDNSLQPQKYVIAAGTMMAPGMFLRFLCDDGQPATNNNTGFALSASGGAAYLYDAATNGGSPRSSITYGLQTADLSIGRVPDGSTNWVLTSPTLSGPNAAVPSFGDQMNLKVNEWMAAPASGSDWFEIYNPNTQPAVLGGLWLSDNLVTRMKHPITQLSFIGAGTNAWCKFIADRDNTAAGADHVGFALDAGGEAVAISTTNGTLIDGASFGVQVTGVSQGRFPDGATNSVSFPGTESPGESNYRWLTNVAVSEILSHTLDTLEDAIELQNLTAQDIDISGWWLSDDKWTVQKYQIPFGTVLPSNGFAVFYAYQFTNRLVAAIPFGLSSKGDEVVLSAATNGALNGYRSHVKFGAAELGISFGGYVTSDRRQEFVAMSARTFGVDDPSSVEEFRLGTGVSNAYPKIGPVVISQIMYHPLELVTNDNVRDEFIELHNITTSPVELYDPAYPSNVWHVRDAVDFNFPLGTVIPAGGYLLVVSFDPVANVAASNAFIQAYQFDAGVAMVGPYTGKLANDDDEIELRRPGTPDTNDVPYILVERVHYYDWVPWPRQADGTGMSLHRVSYKNFGNDPANWIAAIPSQGSQAAPDDFDQDGMLDDWEIAHGFDPFNPWDASLDTDGDGLTNLQEFLAGTDPRDPLSGLRFQSIALGPEGTNIVLTFFAVANATYTIQYSDAIASGVWISLQNVAAEPSNRVVQVSVPATGAARFYRLRSPAIASDPVSLSVSATPTTVTVSWPANAAGYVLQSASSLAISGTTWQAITNGITDNGTLKTYELTPAPGTGPLFFRLEKP